MSSEIENQAKQANTPISAAHSTHWVGAWYAAPSRMLKADLSGRTLRQIVHLHAGGEQLRLRLSNRYGDGPVTLSSISVGQALQGPIVIPGERAVCFAGKTKVTLEPGQAVVSDPVVLRVEAFKQVAGQARQTYRGVFGTTLLPGGYPAEQVEQRQLVNSWMREQGHEWFDAVFDFATPLASPDDEALLLAAYDSGDGTHPNDEGYRLMAEAVDISLLAVARIERREEDDREAIHH